MPRIDPGQLLDCLAVLLSPQGGILSREEVPRLVNLMTKFSKKLVSKCVYILILKNTDRNLVDLFMGEGGWNLIHTLLQDAIHNSNWDLVSEILSLLLITPVDVERLKLNNIPKLVKSLSKLEDVKGVQDLSSQLVHDWLVIVKSNTKSEDIARADSNDISACSAQPTVDSSQIQAVENTETDSNLVANALYKITVRDGKQIIRRTISEADKQSAAADTIKIEPPTEIKEEPKEDVRNREKSKSKSDSKSKSSSSKHSSHSKSSSRDKDRDRHKSSSKSSSSSKDKDRRDRDKSKDKHKSSSGGKETKEKQAEKDKDTLAKIRPQSIEKLGRIPKKTDEKTKDQKELKKSTMSIEVRKMNEERPKTVKVFNSKRRSTGLEEEAKPAPPRPVKKTPVSLPPSGVPQKRSSPIRDLVPPPEKKPKVEAGERPGAIKLIPPKPKPPILQESDIFMDALNASATAKKEPKKRKRRLSLGKESEGSPNAPQEPTSPVTSPLGLKNIAAPKFYQDTLEENDESVKSSDEAKDEDEPSDVTTEEIESRPNKVAPGQLKGVLMYTKRKGPTKRVKFNDDNLTQVRFFELDETERVNVTKNFMDMAKMEMTSEREALQNSRKLPNEDTMEPQTMWRIPYLTDLPDPLAFPGSKSLEKDIQFAREKSVLQALYFDKRKIPDSPEEPIPENHQMSDPIIIPLEDSDSQEMDLRNTPWPEPKGSPPHVLPENMPAPFLQSMPAPFVNFPQAGPPPFQAIPPRFVPQGPNVFGGPGPNLLPNGNILGPHNMGPPPEMIHNSHLNPNAFGPGPDAFNPMINDNFPMPFNNPNMGMFPQNNNFNMNRGGNRGGFRRGGGGNNAGPWLRMNGPGPGGMQGNWNNNRGGAGGAGGRGSRICRNLKNHGICRNMDKCPFIHPK